MNKINIEKLFKFSADMICLIDSKGVFMSVSNSSLHILGYTPLEMLGKFYKDFIFPDDIPLAETARENMQTSSHIQFQNRYIHKNGSLIPLLWSASWDKREGLAYCIARNGHITKQAESLRLSLEESNKRYKYVTKATSDAIWDWDLEKGSLYWGDGFEAIFGYDIQKVPGGISSWTEHIHPDDSVTVLKSIYAVINGSDTNWKQEYRYRKADGSFADVVDRGFVIRNDDGKAVRMVGAMHDISERKIALKQLKRITEDLYKHNRELHEFGYIVSHNLRSPVANIMGIATLLELEDDPEILSRCTADLKTSVFRLDEVIKDLSKILSTTDDSVELVNEKVDFSEMIRNVETDLSERINETCTKIFSPIETFYINTHKAYIYSIFFNLISNSIKYRSALPPVIHIDISIDYEENSVRIKLSDNGLGIDLTRNGEELFKPYKRFHPGIDGKGLGLFLVKSHVEALSGEISIRSEIGHGTVFTITLPRISN